MKWLDELFKYDSSKTVCGLTSELIAEYIVHYYNHYKKDVIVLANSLYEANNIYKQIKTYVDECLLFPMDDFITSVAIAISPDFELKRLEVLEKLKKENKKHIVVTSLMGYLKYLPNVNDEQDFLIDPSPSIISREIILDKLDQFGYKKSSIVTSTGEYAVRGYIIDIFPGQANMPVRLELFGDEVEKIKEFDPDTQLSTRGIDKIEIKKMCETTASTPSKLIDYMDNCSLFLLNDSQISAAYEKLCSDMLQYRIDKGLPQNHEFMFDYNSIYVKDTYKIDTLNLYKGNNYLAYDSKEIENFKSDFDKLQKYCKEMCRGNTIIFVLNKDKQIKKISDLFPDALYIKNDIPINNHINILKSVINKGYIINNYIVITPFDIENTKTIEINTKLIIELGKKLKLLMI